VEVGTATCHHDAVLISISTPGRDRLSTCHSMPWRRTLRLAFHDCDEGELDLHPFSWDQAALVLEFAQQNLHCDWHVHCDAGKSRSVAIGRYLAGAAGRELKLHAVASDIFANSHVLRTLREAEERRTTR